MKDETERKVPAPQGSVTASDRFAKVRPSRRRLLAGGLLAAPILASIQARNALATPAMTPSGNLSGNVSTGAQIGAAYGYSASYWDSGTGTWPVDPMTRFHDIFASGANANWGNDKLKKVVGLYASSNASEQLGAYFAAAYLNVMKGLVSIPGFDKTGLVNLLKGIWGDWVATGFYKVNATVSWDGAQIKTYLTSNGIVGT